MILRRSLLACSVLDLSMASLVPVHADQSSQSNEGGKSSENFQYTGIRSNGFPIRNWQDLVKGGSSAPTTSSPSTNSDQDNSDTTWLRGLAASLNQGGATAKYVVGGAAAAPITCHGTCITMTGSISLIPVWVGAWAPGDITTWNSILGNIVTSLGSGVSNPISAAGHVLNTNSLYFTTKAKAVPSLRWVTNTAVTAPTATSVSDANVATDINSFISTHPTIVPAGTSPIYIYIGAKSTRLTSGFGTKYCGWHTYGTTSSLKNVQYIAIQDFTSTYYNACSAQLVSPNNSVSLDAMASVLTHEIDETITDPFLNAWYDSVGSENADKCAWTFGTTSTVGTAKYNVTLGSIKYLIQQNWLANNLVTATGLATGAACSITG